MNSHKLSLRSAIFINLNIILGAGIFINSTKLVHHLGPWGALSYAVVGILLLPLILAMAQLVKIHKGGSFYDYAAGIHPFAGFMSQWCYFVGKLAACALSIHIFVSLMQALFVPLKNFSTLTLDSSIVLFFMLLNMLNLRINKSIQISFFALKMIPILCIIIFGIFYFSPYYLIDTALDINQLFVTIPFALYAFTGFEATCSLINTLENPETNGPKAILYSYGLSVLIAVTFQTLVYILIGPQLHGSDTFLTLFPLAFKAIFSGTSMQHYGVILMHTAIACSALGAAYSIMFSNSWNLYTLAGKGFKQNAPALWLSQNNVPYVCILTEVFIILCYLWYTQGAQVPLQQTNILALVITFTFSVVGLFWYSLKNRGSELYLSIFATISCMLLLAFLVKNYMHYQMLPSYPFVFLVSIGVFIFLTHFKQHQRT
ncbi:MAG: APC family permease [Candidatus Babeliaceae bacterium]|nr:APC family permease [Candidatus Babeliaceae bacterium]